MVKGPGGFFKGKRIFLTGHTGFKGAWMCRLLALAGGNVTGYALEPHHEPNLFSMSYDKTCDIAVSMGGQLHSVTGDIRDRVSLFTAFEEAQPEIVFHMAAQPLVQDGYQKPAYTYETNVMGTVNLLDCVRIVPGVRSVINVTTDKVYQNQEWVWGYRETDALGGIDPYSCSKSCSELITQSYIHSFFKDEDAAAISTVRAGNVIGGGDFAENRIIPDCVRGALEGIPVKVRNPDSVRPYQHVLESLSAYLCLAEKQWENKNVSGSYNAGPGERGCVTTRQLVDLFCSAWGEGMAYTAVGEESREKKGGSPYHEAGLLKLDCSKIRQQLLWHPCWDIATAVEKIVEWTKVYAEGGSTDHVMNEQIKEYFGMETDKEKKGEILCLSI